MTTKQWNPGIWKVYGGKLTSCPKCKREIRVSRFQLYILDAIFDNIIAFGIVCSVFFVIFGVFIWAGLVLALSLVIFLLSDMLSRIVAVSDK